MGRLVDVSDFRSVLAVLMSVDLLDRRRGTSASDRSLFSGGGDLRIISYGRMRFTWVGEFRSPCSSSKMARRRLSSAAAPPIHPEDMISLRQTEQVLCRRLLTYSKLFREF